MSRCLIIFPALNVFCCTRGARCSRSASYARKGRDVNRSRRAPATATAAVVAIASATVVAARKKRKNFFKNH